CGMPRPLRSKGHAQKIKFNITLISFLLTLSYHKAPPCIYLFLQFYKGYAKTLRLSKLNH
ncbi:MAG: hypothetical protein RML38_10120, partial [Bacteroidia bacterium]|nr:hypothetical protein [Bacteroidia bacterium]